MSPTTRPTTPFLLLTITTFAFLLLSSHVQAFIRPTLPSSSSLSKGLTPSSSSVKQVGRFGRTAMQMNIADRFFRVVKANINSVLQNMEDPEKVCVCKCV
jgi:hypothetical protein